MLRFGRISANNDIAIQMHFCKKIAFAIFKSLRNAVIGVKNTDVCIAVIRGVSIDKQIITVLDRIVFDTIAAGDVILHPIVVNE